MRLFPAVLLLVPSAFLSSVLAHRVALVNPHRHSNATERAENENGLTERASYEYMNKRATNFDAGLSACGPTYSPSDFVVALAQNTFGYSYPSPYCNRPIVIAYKGKTAHAKIVDSCELCAQYDPHALDLTDGLFAYFAPIDIGVIYIDWSFTDEGNPDPATTTHHTTTTTRHTTSTKPTTTSHSTTTTKSTSSQGSTASHTTSTATSTSSAPTGTATGNFDSVAEVILNLQNVMNAAAA